LWREAASLARRPRVPGQPNPRPPIAVVAVQGLRIMQPNGDCLTAFGSMNWSRFQGCDIGIRTGRKARWLGMKNVRFDRTRSDRNKRKNGKGGTESRTAGREGLPGCTSEALGARKLGRGQAGRRRVSLTPLGEHPRYWVGKAARGSLGRDDEKWLEPIWLL
jgi:hypothetical protein